MTSAYDEVAARPHGDVRTVAPYGSWASPITSAMLAAGAKPIDGGIVEGDVVYWLEGVFGEGGRMAVVRSVAHGSTEVLIPAPFDVRTRVHEYGGGAWIVDRGVVIFSNFADNRVHRRDVDGRITALTDDPNMRHADFAIDRERRRLIAVREAHGGNAEPRNSLVAIPIDPDGDGDPVELAGGHDFYAAPRLSGDGRRLAWICWDHPRMPWDGTELWIADVADDGVLRDARRIAGGPDESLTQPLWSPSGALFVVSDRSGWWNLHRVDGDRLVNVLPMEAEFAAPAWSFAHPSYGFVDATTVVASCIEDGLYRLLRVRVDEGTWTEVATAFAVFESLCVGRASVVALVSSEAVSTGLVEIELATGDHRIFARSVERLPDPRYLSRPRRIRFASDGGRIVQAIHYPPRNDDHAGPADQRPPLIVQGHGGPTSMTNVGLRLGNHYWTSRGFAVLDIDYVGSSGYGRAFRQALKGRWGVADLDDFVAGALHLADGGLADRERIAIRGGSASGYTALAALTFHDVFRAGVSYYGVSDLATMFRDTHKFESHYGDWLVGSIEHPERIAERSPLPHADRITAPMLFLQGLDDRVVPPSQSEAIVDSLRSRGVPVAYLAFAGEGHGFRRFETLVRACEAELAFYARVFGFEPADAVEPLVFEGCAASAVVPS